MVGTSVVILLFLLKILGRRDCPLDPGEVVVDAIDPLRELDEKNEGRRSVLSRLLFVDEPQEKSGGRRDEGVRM
ncbi:hypothetical protein EJ05DRAFT_333112 [Pseudovirgaria hyperparasitica]|uniref:Uncharacterized protein n=1 Tax=Pseudovirgaria hyperparasitica TaxID=470096 RepID=A0A6A6WAP3_9PEZI|nr:uncharacterized protein EJ05DRAFT_333112 [Pseudovirgaria hyperparasitica]KAF2759104.1 hypothetical protein EJ05DRAFT_333112 [Pseudovirgaria hyperparasitica]